MLQLTTLPSFCLFLDLLWSDVLLLGEPSWKSCDICRAHIRKTLVVIDGLIKRKKKKGLFTQETAVHLCERPILKMILKITVNIVLRHVPCVCYYNHDDKGPVPLRKYLFNPRPQSVSKPNQVISVPNHLCSETYLVSKMKAKFHQFYTSSSKHSSCKYYSAYESSCTISCVALEAGYGSLKKKKPQMMPLRVILVYRGFRIENSQWPWYNESSVSTQHK